MPSAACSALSRYGIAGVVWFLAACGTPNDSETDKRELFEAKLAKNAGLSARWSLTPQAHFSFGSGFGGPEKANGYTPTWRYPSWRRVGQQARLSVECDLSIGGRLRVAGFGADRFACVQITTVRLQDAVIGSFSSCGAFEKELELPRIPLQHEPIALTFQTTSSTPLPDEHLDWAWSLTEFSFQTISSQSGSLTR